MLTGGFGHRKNMSPKQQAWVGWFELRIPSKSNMARPIKSIGRYRVIMLHTCVQPHIDTPGIVHATRVGIAFICTCWLSTMMLMGDAVVINTPERSIHRVIHAQWKRKTTGSVFEHDAMLCRMLAYDFHLFFFLHVCAFPVRMCEFGQRDMLSILVCSLRWTRRFKANFWVLFCALNGIDLFIGSFISHILRSLLFYFATAWYYTCIRT